MHWQSSKIKNTFIHRNKRTRHKIRRFVSHLKIGLCCCSSGNRIRCFFNCWPQWLVFVIHFWRSAFVFLFWLLSVFPSLFPLLQCDYTNKRQQKQCSRLTDGEKSAHSEHFLDFSRDMSMCFFFLVVFGISVPMSSSHCIIGCSYQTNENDPNLYRIRPAIYDYCTNNNNNTRKSIQQLSIWVSFIFLSLYFSVFRCNCTNLIRKLKEIQRKLPHGMNAFWRNKLHPFVQSLSMHHPFEDDDEQEISQVSYLNTFTHVGHDLKL